MSFWDLSTGETAANTGTEYEVPSGNIEPIPAGSSVLAMIDEIKWDRKLSGEEFIAARWTVLAPEEYKNRKVFHKLWVTDADPGAKDETAAKNKRDKARKMLAAIDANAGGKLTAKPRPLLIGNPYERQQKALIDFSLIKPKKADGAEVVAK